MSDIAFSFSSDEKDVVRGIRSIGMEQGKLREQISNLVAVSKSAAEADTKLSQQRLAALNALVEKQKILKAQADALNQQLKDGKITAEQYKASFEGIAKETDAARAELQKLQAQVKEDSEDFKKAAVISGVYEDKTKQVARAIAELNRMRDKGALSASAHAKAVAAENAKLTEGVKAGSSFSTVLGETATKMAAAAAGAASLMAAVNLLKSEYEALLEKQGRSKGATISLAAEQESLLMNLAGEDAGAVTGKIRGLSRKTGVNEADLTRAVNEALGARADRSLEDILNAAEGATKIRKFAPQELAGLTGATIDTQKQTGLGTNQALGFLMQLQSQARTATLSSLAKNFTPAVGSMMQLGTDRSTAGGILAAMSHGMGDMTGEQTATSGIRLVEQMREYGRLNGGLNVNQTLQKLQTDEAFRTQFMKPKTAGGFGATFEVKALAPIESLLGGGKQAQQFAAARQVLQQDPLAAFNAGIANRNGLSALALAESDMRLGNITNQVALGDESGAQSSIVRDRLKEMRNALGNTAIGSRFSGMLDDVTTGGSQDLQTAIGFLENEKRKVSKGGIARANAGPNFGVVSNVNTEIPQSESDKKTEELLTQQIEQLKELVKLMSNNNQQAADKKHAGIVGGRRAAQQEAGR